MKHCALGKKKKACQQHLKEQAIHFECVLFGLHCNYTEPYFASKDSKKELPQTSVLGAKNATLNEAGEPLKQKANESRS